MFVKIGTVVIRNQRRTFADALADVQEACRDQQLLYAAAQRGRHAAEHVVRGAVVPVAERGTVNG